VRFISIIKIVTNRSKLDFTPAIAAARIVEYLGRLGGLLVKATHRTYDSHMEKAQMRLAPIKGVY
jgi:uncharacterized membrane protein